MTVGDNKDRAAKIKELVRRVYTNPVSTPAGCTATVEVSASASVDSAGPPKTGTESRELDQLDPHVQRQQAVTNDLRSDTALKALYAKFFVGILIGQLVLMNLIFAGVGIGCLKFDQYALHLYMGGTLTEVFGVVYVITRYLFSKKPSEA